MSKIRPVRKTLSGIDVVDLFVLSSRCVGAVGGLID